MPSRRTKNTGLSSSAQEQLSKELRQSRLALFIQQFEKEAQEHMNEMERKMDNMLATVERVFKVELMKMPPSLLNARIGDLITEDELSSVALKDESLEMHQPLKRAPSKKVKLSEPSKMSKGGRGGKRTRTLPSSNSTGSLRSSSTTVKRTVSRLAKTSDQTVLTKPKLRSVSSAGDVSCLMAGCAPHITITTSQGQTVCFSEETKDTINLDLLDDVAWCQIQNLTRLINYLSHKAKGPTDV
ncbi:borealin-2 [Myripristis murdjan]|uniref:Borealin-2-like n=1 Tax=Myripristis murdjan TaxID=586833 RepID=A0A667Z038_9TELE|nr:borealin-2-like [Myripristis murdjan]